MQKMETNLAHCFIICFITYADIVFASSVYMYIIYIIRVFYMVVRCRMYALCRKIFTSFKFRLELSMMNPVDFHRKHDANSCAYLTRA